MDSEKNKRSQVKIKWLKKVLTPEEVVFKLKTKVLEGVSLEKKPARGRADVWTNPDTLMQA